MEMHTLKLPHIQMREIVCIVMLGHSKHVCIARHTLWVHKKRSRARGRNVADDMQLEKMTLLGK